MTKTARSAKARAVHMRVVVSAIMLVAATTLAIAQTARTQTRSVQPNSVRSKSVPAARVAPSSAAGKTSLASTGSATGGADVIARVGKTNLSGNDIRAYIAALPARERAQLQKHPELLTQTVRALLAGRLVLQQVLAKKWDQQPDVAAQLARVRDNAVVELYLKSVSMPPADFPTDEQVQKVYDANRAAFLTPRQFHLAQIFVPVAKGADKATLENARRNAEDIERKLKSGADFAGLANENGSKSGGDLGWVAETQIRPEIRNQVMGLAKNAISGPIQLDDGWHILKLIDTKASYTRTLLEVRDQLMRQMRAGRAAELRQAYVAALLEQTPPTINEIALSKVLDGSDHAKQ